MKINRAIILALVGLLAVSWIPEAFCQKDVVGARPFVRLSQDFILVKPETDDLQLPVELIGSSQSPVKAEIGIYSQDGDSLAPSLSAVWPPGTSKDLDVAVPGLKDLLAQVKGSLMVRIVKASNAAIEPSGSSTLITTDPDLPQFIFEPNAAAYPEHNGNDHSIKVLLKSGVISEPATLKYQFVEQNSLDRAYLNSAGPSGFLQIKADASAQPGAVVGSLSVPLDWSAVPADAHYRVGLVLEGFYAAWAADQAEDVALHVFGVPLGTCPPGSAVRGKRKAGGSKDDAESEEQTAVELQQKFESPAGPVDVLPGGGTLALSIYPSGSSSNKIGNSGAATAVPLSTRSMTDGAVVQVQVGGMVGMNVTSAVLCVSRPGSKVVAASEENKVHQVSDGAAEQDCSGTAWELELLPGSNQFNVSTSTISSTGNTQNTFLPVALSVVRLADPEHAKISSLKAVGLDGDVVIICGPPSLILPSSGSSINGSESSVDDAAESGDVRYNSVETKAATSNEEDNSTSISGGKKEKVSNASPAVENEDRAVEMVALDAWKSCTPEVAMAVTVPASTDTISITPTLIHPEIQQIRVEINGQVLSRGGDVGADQVSDTSEQPQSKTKTDDNTALLLPSAFVMGMQPGVPIEVEVIVVAEDGVTSAHYPITITREEVLDGSSGSTRLDSNVTYGTADGVMQEGWPALPSEQPMCQICPAGWSSATVNASACEMCPPGTSAESQGAVECQICAPGTFSLPWGSTHCKHCIVGTHAPQERATSCTMCPEGTTTVGDGQPTCNVTLGPATDLGVRYAVVVYFSVKLNGISPEDVVLKAGVSAPAEMIVSNLVKSDTAAAFNISVQDVHVLSVNRIARRILQANVSATLGVDLPSNATEEDIAAALDVQKLSADRPIELLSQDPDAFFGRTTKTLEVVVHPGSDIEKIESRPSNKPPFNRWALVAPGIFGAIGGAALVFMSFRKRRRSGAGRWTRMGD